jgi:hypothetical protein
METASKVVAIVHPVENLAGVHLQNGEIDIKPKL